MQTKGHTNISDTGLPATPEKRCIFYGWWIVVLAGLVMIVATVPVSDSFPSLVVALEEDFNWKRFEISGALTILGVVSLLLGPVVGFLGDRVDIRRLVVAGLIVLAGAFFLFNQTQNLWMYYTAAALMAVGATMSGWILLVTVVSRWFVRRRATAIALVYMAGSLGSMSLAPLIDFSLASDSDWLGWRLTAIVVGGIIVVVAVVALIWLRNRPQDKGLQPDGGLATVRPQSFPAFQFLHTRAFWLVVLGDGFAAMEVLGLGDSAFASVLLGIVSFVFLLVGGLVGDRFSKSTALACFTSLQVVAWAALTFGESSAALYLSAVALGISIGGRTPIRVAILADYFGTNSLAVTLGLFGFFVWLTALVGGSLAGLLYETQGDVPGFLFLAGLTLLAAFLFLKADPPLAVSGTAPQQMLGNC